MRLRPLSSYHGAQPSIQLFSAASQETSYSQRKKAQGICLQQLDLLWLDIVSQVACRWAPHRCTAEYCSRQSYCTGTGPQDTICCDRAPHKNWTIQRSGLKRVAAQGVEGKSGTQRCAAYKAWPHDHQRCVNTIQSLILLPLRRFERRSYSIARVALLCTHTARKNKRWRPCIHGGRGRRACVCVCVLSLRRSVIIVIRVIIISYNPFATRYSRTPSPYFTQ